MKTDLHTLLATSGPILADGGMGTMLMAHGLTVGNAPELWNVEHPNRIQAVHRGYVEAGAQIILTNSFGGNRLRLALHDLAERAAELNQAAGRIARRVADAASHPVVVAGSMGPTGGLLKPLGELDYETMVEVYQQQAAALAEGGVDVFWVETMSSLEEVRAALQGARQAAPDRPSVATMTFESRGHTMMGVSPEKALDALAGEALAAFGANCGNGPGEVEAALEKMRAVAPDTTLVAKSNAGLPHMEGMIPVYDAGPPEMAAHAVKAHQLGARIIGACCGSTPEHIQAMARALAQAIEA
jgi:5-methyltetrahydrofolate--homocysteine methyltransferase